MAPQYEDEKDGKLLEQNGLNGLRMVKFECPRHGCTCSYLLLPHILLPLPSLPSPPPSGKVDSPGPICGGEWR